MSGGAQRRFMDSHHTVEVERIKKFDLYKSVTEEG